MSADLNVYGREFSGTIQTSISHKFRNVESTLQGHQILKPQNDCDITPLNTRQNTRSFHTNTRMSLIE